MKVSTRRVVLPTMAILSIILLAFGYVSIAAASSSIPVVRRGQSAQWLVTSSSNVTTMWYSEMFSPRGNFSAPVGSTIDLTMTSTSDNRFRGNVSIGQLALNDVSMTEISFNLLLGWYPFQPGLVSPTNWEVQKQNATSNGLTATESRIGGLDTITFRQLSGNNGTILVYDKATGLLIGGYGAFGQFLIEVTLISTSIDVGLVQSNYQMLGFICFMIVTITIVLAISGILILRERSADKKAR